MYQGGQKYRIDFPKFYFSFPKLIFFSLNLFFFPGLRRTRLTGFRRDDSEGRRLQPRWKNQQERTDDDSSRDSETQPRRRDISISIRWKKK